MISFSGWEYLLIDVANRYGLDKLLFRERIQWVTDNFNNLESLADTANEKPTYIKAVMAIRDAQAGKAIGHLVALDSVCSGIQIMSVLTGCVTGATATGLIDPEKRSDAYSQLTDTMRTILGTNLSVTRSDAKDAMLTSFYGSKKRPKEIFGEKTPALAAFYKAAVEIAPGAWGLLQNLLESWQRYALSHNWKLPDGYDVKIKVMSQYESRIEVDELDHATFTYIYYENEGKPVGKSNAAKHNWQNLQ